MKRSKFKELLKEDFKALLNMPIRKDQTFKQFLDRTRTSKFNGHTGKPFKTIEDRLEYVEMSVPRQIDFVNNKESIKSYLESGIVPQEQVSTAVPKPTDLKKQGQMAAAAPAATATSDVEIENQAKQNVKNFVDKLIAQNKEPTDEEIEALENKQEEAVIQKIVSKHGYTGEFKDFALKLFRKSLLNDDPNLHVLAQKDYILIGPRSVLQGNESGAKKVMVAGFTAEMGKRILGGEVQSQPKTSNVLKTPQLQNPEFQNLADAAKKVLTSYDASNTVRLGNSRAKLNKYITDEELTDEELDDTTGVSDFRNKAKTMGILEYFLYGSPKS